MSAGGGSQARIAIEELIARGRPRGYVTYGEINRAISPEQISSDDIESLMARLIELGIAVVDSGAARGDP